MKIIFRKRSSDKLIKSQKLKARIRKKVFGTTEKPRLSVFKSASAVYAQVIDDDKGVTLVSCSSRDIHKKKARANIQHCKDVGALLAQRVLMHKIKKVVFDRNGRAYHGGVKALADSAREKGLQF